jgi:hypothetical protein
MDNDDDNDHDDDYDDTATVRTVTMPLHCALHKTSQSIPLCRTS